MDVYDTGPLSPNSQTVSVYGSLLKDIPVQDVWLLWKFPNTNICTIIFLKKKIPSYTA